MGLKLIRMPWAIRISISNVLSRHFSKFLFLNSWMFIFRSKMGNRKHDVFTTLGVDRRKELCDATRIVERAHIANKTRKYWFIFPIDFPIFVYINYFPFENRFNQSLLYFHFNSHVINFCSRATNTIRPLGDGF